MHLFLKIFKSDSFQNNLNVIFHVLCLVLMSYIYFALRIIKRNSFQEGFQNFVLTHLRNAFYHFGF